MTSNTDALTAALVVLSRRGIPSDILTLLVQGNPERGIAPGALLAAMQSAQPPQEGDDTAICDACDGSGFGVADTLCGKCDGSGGIPYHAAQPPQSAGLVEAARYLRDELNHSHEPSAEAIRRLDAALQSTPAPAPAPSGLVEGSDER